MLLVGNRCTVGLKLTTGATGGRVDLLGGETRTHGGPREDQENRGNSRKQSGGGSADVGVVCLLHGIKIPGGLGPNR